MATITIPKNLISKKNLIAIPYEEYKRFVSFSNSKEISLSVSQKRRLQSARKNLKTGRFLTINELKRKLGHKN